MNKGLQREIVGNSVRVYYRTIGIDPYEVSEFGLHRVIQILSQREPNGTVALWNAEASDNQWRLLQQEWRGWKRNVAFRREHQGGRP